MTKQHGYSLFELMMTLAVSVIVLNIAISGIAPILDNARTRASVSSLDAGFRLARQTAAEQAQIVTLCALNPDQTCGASWDHPISIFLDPDNERELISPNRLLRIIEPRPQVSYIARPTNRPHFQYDALGEIRGATGGHVNICPGNETLAHARIVIGPSGRTRIIWDDPGDRGCD